MHFPARDAGTKCGGRCVAPSPLLISATRNTKIKGIHNRWDVSFCPLGRGGHSRPGGRASTICSRSPRHAPRLGTPFGAARACLPLVRAAARIGAGRANRKHPRRRYAVASRFPGTACPLQRGCPSAERCGAMGCAPRSTTAPWAALSRLGPGFVGGSPQPTTRSLGAALRGRLRRDGEQKRSPSPCPMLDFEADSCWSSCTKSALLPGKCGGKICFSESVIATFLLCPCPRCRPSLEGALLVYVHLMPGRECRAYPRLFLRYPSPLIPSGRASRHVLCNSQIRFPIPATGEAAPTAWT